MFTHMLQEGFRHIDGAWLYRTSHRRNPFLFLTTIEYRNRETIGRTNPQVRNSEGRVVYYDQTPVGISIGVH